MKTLCHWVAVGSLFLASTVHADDWPQWRGPNRDDVSKETGLLKTWPKGGPKLAWKFSDAGKGYSSFSVVGDKLYSLGADSKDNKEYLFSLDTKNGKKLWSTEVSDYFKQGMGDGPRSTPTIDGDLIFVLTGNSNLVCVDRTKGKQIWKKNLIKDLDGKLMSGWGYSESPLVDGDQVVCMPGGSKGTIAAFNKKNGEILWRTKDLGDPAPYSSLMPATFNNIKQYVVMTATHVAGVAADDGRLLWKEDHNSRVAATPTPVVHDNLVYVTSGYRAGCCLIKLTADGKNIKSERIYAYTKKDEPSVHNHHGGMVRVGDYVYGYTGANEGDLPREWVCQELTTGKIAWREKDKLKKGSITYADGHFYLYSEDKGEVVLLQASSEGWKEDGRFSVPRDASKARSNGRVWTHPVVANGKLYLRDQDLLFCYDVKASIGGR